jgi:hypothetical protein
MKANLRQDKLGREQGSTLIVVIVLLLLLTLIGLFGANVALNEQRSSGSDLRARIVRQTAEAGLAHAIEYVRASSLIPTEQAGAIDASKWTLCLANETSFPCGAVPAARRASMYKFTGGGVDVDGSGGALDEREKYLIRLPTLAGERQAFAKVGNFDVNYGVGAVLCTFSATADCTTIDEDRTGLGTVTMVSWAEIPNENARITVSETYGSFTILNIPPSAPPLVAGGIIQGVGNATIVANADSAGPGAHVSIWSRGEFDTNNGSWQTCQLDEYMRLSGGTSQYAGESGVIVCDNCDCPKKGDPLNTDASYAKGPAGKDLLIPPHSNAATNKALFLPDRNGDGTVDEVIKPSVYFPCDMFEYVFGVRSRLNTNGGELVAGDGLDDTTPADGIPDAEAGLPYGICENGIDADADGKIDAVVEYLKKNAIPYNAAATPPVTKFPDCSTLNAQSSGLYWVENCSLSKQIGTPENPVVLVIEGNIDGGTAGKIFGVIFGLDSGNVDIAESSTAESARPKFLPGGGSFQVYGAIILEGNVKINAGVHLVASPKVIENFNKNPANMRYGVVPGSWTDRLSY